MHRQPLSRDPRHEAVSVVDAAPAVVAEWEGQRPDDLIGRGGAELVRFVRLRSVHRTAEAEALTGTPCPIHLGRHAACAETAPNGARRRTGHSPGGRRKIPVEDKELLMEPGVGQHGLVQGVTARFVQNRTLVRNPW